MHGLVYPHTSSAAWAMIGWEKLGAGWMSDAGVDLSYLFRSEQKATGCGFVMINREGVPAMTTALGANEELSPSDIDRAKSPLATTQLVLVTFEFPVPPRSTRSAGQKSSERLPS